jgi:hypothetical protein
MERFLAANPALASRFSERLNFPDYSTDELVAILTSLTEKHNYTLTPAVTDRASAWFEARRYSEGAAFGNARAARSLFGAMESRLAERAIDLADGDPALDIFTVADIPDT